jgi:two-component system NtrC family sensor kinase
LNSWLVSLLLALVAAAAGFILGRRRGVGRMAGQAERARAELAQRVDELQSLQEFSFMLSESLDVAGIVEQVVGYVARSIEADGVLAAVADGGAIPLRVLAARGCLASLEGSEIKQLDAGLIGEAMGAEHVQLAIADSDEAPQLVRGLEVQAAAVAPLHAHGVTVGAIATVREALIPFSTEDMRQLSTVATHATLVLENARLFSLVQTGKRQWEATFDALADGVAVIDNDDAVRRANHAFAELVGQPIPAVINTRIARLLAGESSAFAQYLSAVRSDTAGPTITFRSEPLNRTLRVGAAALPGADDGWIVALIEDITERDAIEGQLIQSEKMAAVGQLVSGIAHELNNPLSSIAAVSEFLLTRESAPDSERQHLSLIHEQAERAGRIVRNLLTFARKGQGGKTHVDLNEITSSAVSLVEHDVKLRQIELTLDLADPAPVVLGDPSELQQVVLNLLTNAVQAVAASAEGRPRLVRLTTSRTDASACLLIADSGPGIPAELASQVFLPFYTTKAPGEGTGLGLSITFRIVESHGGRVTVHPSHVGGAEFEVTLPLCESPDAGLAQHPSAEPDHVMSPPRKGRILVVEEDPAVRRSLSILLSDDGHAVTLAADPVQAMDLIGEDRYDVIILEPHDARGSTSLPDLIFAEHPELRRRTLLITSDVRPESEEWMRSTGCSYLRKPIEPHTLRSVLSELLGHS